MRTKTCDVKCQTSRMIIILELDRRGKTAFTQGLCVWIPEIQVAPFGPAVAGLQQPPI